MTPHHPLCTGAVERGDCEACRREAGRRDDLRAAWKRYVEKNGVLVEVKGDKHAVALAAANRQVPFAFVREYRRDGGPEWVYTIGRVGIQHLDRVRHWFNEPSEWETRAGGYVVGTMTSYNDPDHLDSGPRC